MKVDLRRLKPGRGLARAVLASAGRRRALSFELIGRALKDAEARSLGEACRGLDLRFTARLRPGAGRAALLTLARAGLFEARLEETGSLMSLAVFLKWARHYGVRARWRLPKSSRAVAARLRSWSHLEPPSAGGLGEPVFSWRRSWRGRTPPAFELRRGAGFLELTDLRGQDGRWEAERLEDARAWAYLKLEDPAEEDDVLAAARAGGIRLSRVRLRSWLADWERRGWTFKQGRRHLALALPYRRKEPAGRGWLKLYRARPI